MLIALDFNEVGIWGDFGCSDGFIIEQIRRHLILDKWEFYGFDKSKDLLSEAGKRNIPNSTFVLFDLNRVDNRFECRFDVVSCFETLEHTGNYQNAFQNVYLSAKAGGYILLSVPNETGFHGCIKFMGRKLLRKNPYGSFFSKYNRGEIKYLLTLITGKDIEDFRDREVEHWGPHLGFNYHNLERYVDTEYTQKGKLELVKKENSFLGFNKLYFLRKQ